MLYSQMRAEVCCNLEYFVALKTEEFLPLGQRLMKIQ